MIIFPAARIGDMTVHGGVIVMGSPTCIIGEVGTPSPGAGGLGGVAAGLAVSGVTTQDPKAAALAAWHSTHDSAIKTALKNQKEMLENKKQALARWNDADKAEFKKWFGSDSEAARKKMQDRIDKELKLNSELKPENFKPADPSDPSTFAYVYPGDKTHTIYLDKAFDSAPDTGKDSKAGTLAHEMSHFDDIGGTKDHVYGADNAKALASTDSNKATNNADNFEILLKALLSLAFWLLFLYGAYCQYGKVERGRTKMSERETWAVSLTVSPSAHDVLATVTFANNSAAPAALYKWNACFDNRIHNDVFEIMHESGSVSYTGRLVKRSEPKADDFLTVKPGKGSLSRWT